MEKVLFKDGIFELVSEEKEYLIDGKKKNIKRKYVRRPPGVRAIIINNKNEILLSKEYRYEHECFDYRLPGGKVFDSIEEYNEKIKENNVLDYAYKQVIKETKEEVGILVSNPQVYTISRAGSSIEWDLYYFIVRDYEIINNGQELEEDEVVDGFVFKSKEEIIKMCIDKEIHEERTIGVLLTYLLQESNK